MFDSPSGWQTPTIMPLASHDVSVNHSSHHPCYQDIAPGQNCLHLRLTVTVHRETLHKLQTCIRFLYHWGSVQYAQLNVRHAKHPLHPRLDGSPQGCKKGIFLTHLKLDDDQSCLSYGLGVGAHIVITYQKHFSRRTKIIPSTSTSTIPEEEKFGSWSQE